MQQFVLRLMPWVIMHPGPPPMYVKDYAAYGVTYRATEADRFESEMEATSKMLELKLSRDWFVIMVDGRILEKM